MKSTTAYLVSLIAVLGIGCGSVVALEIFRPEGYNSAVTYAVISMVTPTVAVLIGVLKSIGNGQQLQEVKEHVQVAAQKADLAAVAATEAASKPAVLKADVTLHGDK